MKIAVNNIDRLLRFELSKKCKVTNIGDKPDGVFIQWATSDLDDLFGKQTQIISHCLEQGIPLIIFDKYQKMTPEEVSFLVKPGVFLWEPALNDRMFFSFQPIWGRIPKLLKDVPTVGTNRPLSLGHVSGLRQKLSTFEQYYKPINDIGEHKVVFVDKHANTTINQRVVDMGIDIHSGGSGFSLNSVKTTVLLGTDRDYRVGYIDPNLFTYLENGVVPLLPSEHRWYHSVFRDTLVKDEKDIDFLLKIYDKFAFGFIYDVYRGLEKNLPECDIDNVVRRITTFFK